MICPNCGNDVPPSKYCPECGAKLSKDPEAEAPYAQAGDQSGYSDETADSAEHKSVTGSYDTIEPESYGTDAAQSQADASGKPQRQQMLDLSEAPYSDSGTPGTAGADIPGESGKSASGNDTPPSDAPYGSAPAAQEPPEAESVSDSIGDTIVYEGISSLDSPEAQERIDTASDSAEYTADIAVPAEESDESVATSPQKPDAEDEQQSVGSRVGNKKHARRNVSLTVIIVCLCAAAAIAVGIWQWSSNTPRARLTQALRDGDILKACEIYNTELREEGLTSNEVYYLCAAAEQIADDFEADSTAASYEGRMRLLDELGKLPYKSVQDAVSAAKKRMESHATVTGHMTEAKQAENRGDYLRAIEELEMALAESPGDEAIRSDIERVTKAYRDHALSLADEYVEGGNIAQARMVLLEAMLPERFAADKELRTKLDEITSQQFGLEESSDVARNALDMSRLGQAAFLMQNVESLRSSTARLTEQDLMGVLMSLYEWRNYNSSPIASSEPVLAVVRDALPISTGSAQWPYRVAANPVQILCDALFGERAESINIADTLGTKLYGSYKYEDGWYFFASMTTPSCSVTYADPSALPHLDNNEYTFYSGSDHRADDRLYTMDIRPTITSPFGFTVSSVKTVATGSEARDEAERIISRLPETSESASPSAAPSETASESQTPQENQQDAAPTEVNPGGYAPEGSLTGGLIFPDSDMRYLTDDDLAAAAATYSNLSAALQLARNEIYARRGHIFSDPQYQNYFMQYAWYSPSHSVSDSELNDFELRNLQQIIAWQNGG